MADHDEPNVPDDARPAYLRAAGSPWHVAMHDPSDDGSEDMCLVYPDYDDDTSSDSDGVYVRMDTLQVDADGDASTTSQLWEVRDLERFCRNTLALLNADGALARALNAEEDLEDDDGEAQEEDPEEYDPEEDDGDGDDEGDDDDHIYPQDDPEDED